MLRRIALLAVAVLTMVSVASAKGRDWFVRAGSSGDGSREKPLGDPWEALDKCEAGDAIHVAAGKYFGKMGDAQWKRVVDVSRRNDWSAVRVWYPRTDTLGVTVFPAWGFIHPPRARSEEEVAADVPRAARAAALLMAAR